MSKDTGLLPIGAKNSASSGRWLSDSNKKSRQLCFVAYDFAGSSEDQSYMGYYKDASENNVVLENGTKTMACDLALSFNAGDVTVQIVTDAGELRHISMTPEEFMDALDSLKTMLSKVIAK